MPLPFSDSPARRARLTRVGRVDVGHAYASAFGLVGHEVLKLPEGPAMQSRPDLLSGLDVGADIGQVFHADFTRTGEDCFGNDRLAYFVVHVSNMPLLAPGDSFKLAPCGTATVGVKATAIGKIFVAVVSQFPAAPDLAGTGGSKRMLTHVNATNATAGNRRRIRNVKNEVEIPNTCADDQLRFLGFTARQQVALMLTAGKRHFDAARQRKQREHITLMA